MPSVRSRARQRGVSTGPARARAVGSAERPSQLGPPTSTCTSTSGPATEHRSTRASLAAATRSTSEQASRPADGAAAPASAARSAAAWARRRSTTTAPTTPRHAPRPIRVPATTVAKAVAAPRSSRRALLHRLPFTGSRPARALRPPSRRPRLRATRRAVHPDPGRPPSPGPAPRRHRRRSRPTRRSGATPSGERGRGPLVLATSHHPGGLAGGVDGADLRGADGQEPAQGRGQGNEQGQDERGFRGHGPALVPSPRAPEGEAHPMPSRPRTWSKSVLRSRSPKPPVSSL